MKYVIALCLVAAGGCYDLEQLSQHAGDLAVSSGLDLGVQPDGMPDLATPPDLYVSLIEICDGIDNDKNGRTDEGCPDTTFTLADDTKAMAIGSPTLGMDDPEDHCPAGTAVVGFRVHTATTDCNMSMSLICAGLVVTEDRGTTPFGYQVLLDKVTISTGVEHGTAGGRPPSTTAPTATAMCDYGYVARGVSVKFQAGLGGAAAAALAVDCGKPTVDPKTFAVTLTNRMPGTEVVSPQLGMLACGSSSSSAQTDCVGEGIVVSLHGRGENEVFAVQPYCQSIRLTLRP